MMQTLILDMSEESLQWNTFHHLIEKSAQTSNDEEAPIQEWKQEDETTEARNWRLEVPPQWLWPLQQNGG